MSARQLTVLGTASQVPTRYRNHNGYFLRWDNHGFLFDPGEGTQRQLTLAELAVSNITQICVTHFHGDHCLGLPGIIQRCSLDNVPHEVIVHFPASGAQYFDRLRNASIFYNVAKIAPRPISEAGVVFETDTLVVTTRKLSHSVDSWGYRIQERDGRRILPDKLAEFGVRGPDIGRLQRDGKLEIQGRTITLNQVSELRRGQVFAFVMDTRVCDAALELARDADLLVCESTFLTEESAMAEKAGHMTAAQAAELARQANAQKLVLTHFSRRYPDHTVFLDEATPIHANSVAASDGDIIDVPARRS